MPGVLTRTQSRVVVGSAARSVIAPRNRRQNLFAPPTVTVSSATDQCPDGHVAYYKVSVYHVYLKVELTIQNGNITGSA